MTATPQSFTAQPASTLYVAPSARFALVEGRAVVLDVRAGDYVIFDRVATAMWRALLELAPADRIPTLQATFDAPAAVLEADFRGFEEQCRARGFLSDAPAPPRSPAVRSVVRERFLAWRAWWSLASTLRSIRGSGFASTYARYDALPEPDRADGSWRERLAPAVRAFRRAEQFFVMRSAPQDCLPRSLALYRFLLSAGVPARHCIGVQQYPFRAHAWVEVDERVVCDSETFVRGFVPVART